MDDADYEELNKYKWSLGGSHSSYAVRCTGKAGARKWIYMHRAIMNTPAGMDTDHINRNRLDNRRCNLRICTRSENNGNRIGRPNSKSKYRGVWPVGPNRWVSQIAFKKQRYTVGSFRTEEEAARAWDSKARELFGKFARVNFPD